ncbi:MAG: hypothetical protein GX846_04795 [Deltaproteobacteria bacterium]|nr:hypothetical protein [Deltaproteobacteria bacterium]
MGSSDLAFNMDADLGATKISGSIRGSFMPGQKIQDMVKAPVDNFNFEGKLSYSDNSIGLSDVIIDGNGLTFKAAGTYKPDGALDSRCRVMLPDLGLFSRYTGKEVMGAADMDCSVKGGRDRLELSSRVEVRDLLFDRVRADAVKAQAILVKSSTDYSGKISGEFINGINSTEAGLDIRLSGPDLFISGLRVAGFNTELTGNMRLDLGMTHMDGSIAFISPDVSDLGLIFGLDIRGALSGSLKLHSDQGFQNGELFLSAGNLLFDQGEAEGISVSGTVSDLFNRTLYRAEAEVHGFKRDGLILDKVSISGGGEKERREFHIKGDGKAGQELHFEARAGLLNNEAGAEINIAGLKGMFGAVPFSLLTPLNIKYTSSHLRGENMDLELDSGSLSGGFRTTYEMIEEGLFIEKVPLQLLALAGGPLLDGEADASLSLGGSMSMPLASGKISITGIKQGQTNERQTPGLLINADYSLDSKGVSLNFTADALLSGSLTGYIIYPVKFSVSPFMFVPGESDSLKGNIQGELDLASLTQVFNLHGQSFSGRVTMDFDIGGKYTFPLVSGSAVLSQGRYENTGIGLALKNIAADVSADDSWFTINISADDGLKGTVRSNGRFDLDAQKGFSYEIGTILKNMKAVSMDMLETVVSGDTVVNGSSEGDKISGRVIIENAEFNIPEKLPFEITELEVKEINKKDEEAAEKNKVRSETRDIKFDLAVSSSGRVFIRGRGLESEWKGRLKLEGGADEALITGELSLIKGDYNFLSKPFILTKGNILFSGNSPPDPYLDVTGEIQSSDITAFISIRGNIRNPALHLYSEPVMAQDEILSRILFGRSVSQITPMQAIQLAAALNEMVRGGGGFDPVRFTRNLIGVDRLEIKQSQIGNGGTAVSAGKYLKDNVYIEVERGVSTESGKASITWELTPNFTVGTEMGEDARKGMELNWKYDYR